MLKFGAIIDGVSNSKTKADPNEHLDTLPPNEIYKNAYEVNVGNNDICNRMLNTVNTMNHMMVPINEILDNNIKKEKKYIKI